MADARSRAKEELAQEAEGFTGGPGVTASKTQARGAVGGTMVGAIIGAVVGLLVGLVFFEGALGIAIAVIAFGVGGATFGGVAGGSFRPRKKLQGSEADR